MKIKDSALKALIAEVEAEIGDLLKSEKQKLSKAAEDLDEEQAEASADASPPPEADPSAEASAEASAPMGDAPEDEMSAPAEDSAPAEASAPPPGDDAMQPQEDMAEAAPMDPEALKAEYMKLPPEELEMHLMAAKAAMMEMSGGQDAQADAGAPPPAAPPAPEQSAPAMKAEEKPHKKAQKEEHKDVEMSKSEKSISNERLKELEAQVEGLVKALDLALGQPMRKAVTSVAFVPRTEETKPTLNKGQVMEQLKEVTKQNLKKSDRELINRYCLGEVEVEKIQHLLQVK